MKRYHLYIAKTSLDRAANYYHPHGGGINLAWQKRVLAETRTNAITKCLPEISKLILGIGDPTIKFVSVFVGVIENRRSTAERLSPIQIDVKTKRIRGT